MSSFWGVALAFRVGPAEVLLPIVIIVGIAAFVNAAILFKGPSVGEGVVRRTDDTDRDGNPVHGSEIMLADSRKVEIRWSDITPNGCKINDLPGELASGFRIGSVRSAATSSRT